MTGIDKLIEHLAAATVEENEKEKEVSFAGQGLKVDTEEDAEKIVNAINSCPGMTTLELQGNTIGIPGAKVIAKALEKQPNFKKALWKDMFTRRTVDEIPQALNYLSDAIISSSAKLVVLDLSDNAFGPRSLVGIVKLLESPACYTLQELHLNNNGLGIQGAKILAEALCKCVENSRRDGSPLSLKIFVCGRNRLENEGATAMAKFFKELGTLESVAMPQNGIYAPGIKKLADAFISNPSLKVINLEDNSFTAEGAKYIADCLPSLKQIIMLNFGDCLVRTKGAFALADALKVSCPQLRELYLGFNEINREGGKAIVDAMENKTELDILGLNGNVFGDEGCEMIQNTMKRLGLLDKLQTLSEDEGDDEEEDDDENVEDEESDSANEDPDTSVEIVDNKDYDSPMHKATLAEFLSSPTAGALVYLQKADENVLSALPDEPTVSDYLDLFSKICSVVQPGDDTVKSAACIYADDILSKAVKCCDVSEFNNTFLVCLGMLKGENKKPLKGIDISGALLVLQHTAKQSYFHASTRDLLKFFLSRPLNYVTACEKTKHSLMQILYQL